MNDRAVQELARRAGIMVEWTDYADTSKQVTIESLRAILTALGLPCESPQDVAHSHQLLEAQKLPALITATAGQAITLPFAERAVAGHARLCHENGIEQQLEPGGSALELPPIQAPGYHQLVWGDEHLTVAVAPQRCPSIRDVAGAEKIYGVAAQVYALRRKGDCGIGDTGGVTELARQAARLGADMLALSPVHALFGAEPGHFSPYSPSSRLFYNPLHADARVVFGEERVSAALSRACAAEQLAQLEHQALIDWPRATQAKMAVFRHLFDEFVARDLSNEGSWLAADFRKFRAAGGILLEDHALFEALHAHQLRRDPAAWSWTEWPAPLRKPSANEVRDFAAANQKEVTYHCFLQWLADRSLAAAHEKAKQAGMRIGLVADLAVGMSGAGSHAWTSQSDILIGLEIGAPPDRFNTKGQNWGLTTFSPFALGTNGFAPFIATLRAGLRHSGGLRIDHVMGLLRLWVIPRGADSTTGAYLSYPLKDMLRLIALEAHRHNAIIIGEDLGTVPPGFRDTMAETGLYGMRVLWFEHAGRRFKPPEAWDVAAAAMTSTHDLPPVAGWWRGVDIEMRAQAGLLANAEIERQARAHERRSLWRSFRRANAAEGPEPPPEDAPLAVDAAVNFISEAASGIALLPMEDALGLEEQPNVPGTIDEFPNWRRRYPADGAELLGAPQVTLRLRSLARRGRQ